jgi:hypothetical protein
MEEESTIVRALKLIIAKSPNAGEEAIRTLAAVRTNSPQMSVRYANLLIRAFADPKATFTPEERLVLASAASSGADDNRSYTLRVRLTDEERDKLFKTAEESKLSISEYARKKLFS